MTEAQRKLRYYLLSVPSFTLMTDHKPLLGIDRKLEAPNDEYAAMRADTEEFRDKRTVVYAPGDKQLADYFSRLFEKKVPTQVTPMVNAITFEDGDFLPEPEELQHLQEHLDKYKHKHEVLSDRIYVYTNNVRRTYVPRRTRGALLFTAHGPAHVGENHITALLYHYYWPYKLKEIRTYLRGC
eukprot:jgi/Bigna1/63199/fgenesh1_kg.48_\